MDLLHHISLRVLHKCSYFCKILLSLAYSFTILENLKSLCRIEMELFKDTLILKVQFQDRKKSNESNFMLTDTFEWKKHSFCFHHMIKKPLSELTWTGWFILTTLRDRNIMTLANYPVSSASLAKNGHEIVH